MNYKSTEQLLAEMSYLWTSGKWTLHEFHHSLARIIFVFPDGRPSLRELSAVRALVPRFAESPISLLKSEIGALSEFLAGEFGPVAADRLQSAANARGLQTRVEDASFTSYLPVSVDNVALIIDDSELSRLITDEMRRRGVPVVQTKTPPSYPDRRVTRPALCTQTAATRG